ncbi:asparaginase [Heliorestis acidaminivorans]|uniref:Asparaginase n=1 Tax=Heliorestis acidaminivorans TaxID=553427 RepID=A0A6I0F127_9FIRM|nr:asparaginase [Heliorestis acidaminivorans]KAB2951840.1 asparaginase [Heliorestis acidaminivorans]
MSTLLVEVTRGTMVENRHYGSIVVIDHEGRILASAGQGGPTYMRSSSKPLMTIPLVEKGGMDAFQFQEEHLAIFTSSHTGEEEHRRWVLDSLQKIGLEEEVLACGTHRPFDRKTAEALLRAGEKPGLLHCNCSGKHSGVLAYCLLRGYPLEGYTLPEHSAEKDILSAVADLAMLKAEDIVIGIDGCGIPVYGMPLKNIALAFCRFGMASAGNEARQQACKQIRKAMIKHPFLVAGTGRLDTDLMTVTEGAVVAKIGADGVYALAVPEKGWGMAVKVDDGNMVALGPIVIEALSQLGLLSPEQRQALASHDQKTIKNNLRQTVGEMRPFFTLQ